MPKELTPEQIETIEKVVNIINDINCEIVENQDLRLSDMHKLTEVFWKLYNKFEFQQDKSLFHQIFEGFWALIDALLILLTYKKIKKVKL